MTKKKALGDNPLMQTKEKDESTEYNPEEIREKIEYKPEQETTTKGRPRNENLVRDNPLQEGLTSEWIRASFIVRTDYLQKIKDISYTDRKTIKTIVDRALKLYIDEAEKEHQKSGIEILQWKPRSDE